MTNIKKILARVAGTTTLLMLTFTIGASWHDLRGIHNVQTLRSQLSMVPLDLDLALMSAAHGQTDEETPYETYADVLTTLKENYYSDKQIDTTQMTYNAIRGMVGSLHDRYTTFMDPKAYQEMMEDNEGEFVGIGALLGTNDQNQVYVVKVLPGGPARKYHVMAGDIIVKVDDKPTLKLKDTEVVKLIRGQRNTKVTLTLLRKGTPHPVVLTLPREVVQQEVVQSRMLDPQNHIGYISLSVFNEESDVQLDKAMRELEGQGARGLVLDLRDNPGGLLDIAARIASRFIPAGPVLWTKDKTGPMEPYNTIPGLHRWGRPLVVLVNGNSASAAEILSGSIKDTGAGVLVGEKTFGKGVVQTIMGLRDGSAVKITTQHYYTAHKHDINHKGIDPNIMVKFTNDDQKKLVQFLRKHPDAPYDLQDDRQLQTALSQVTEEVRVASSKPG
jgi:carboxyl-terminal processing protease